MSNFQRPCSLRKDGLTTFCQNSTFNHFSAHGGKGRVKGWGKEKTE